MAQIKTSTEIHKVKKACTITDEIFRLVIKHIKKHKSIHTSAVYTITEIELRDFIVSEIQKRGLEPSFPPIVTSGKRAGNDIHPTPTDKKLTGFVIIDFGVVYEKYMSDMTRTIYVGSPTTEEHELYTTVFKAYKTGISNACVGTKCAYVDAMSRVSLGSYAKYFIHMLGHGVGKKIHENPKIYHKIINHILKENMIITIEPGIYIKNKCGLRIEDTCCITPQGCVPLTMSPKKLIVLK